MASAERPARNTQLIVVIYVVALIAAQASATFLSIEFTLVCNSVLLLVLLNHFALVPASAEMRNVLASIALVPLLRIESVALPQHFISSAYWGTLPMALVLATVYWLRRVTNPSDALPRFELSPARVWPAQLAMALLGVLFAVASAYAVSALDLTSAQPSLVSTPGAVLLVAAFSGVTLEIVFRGVIQPGLVALCGWHGIALTSGLYAAIFIGSGSWFFVVLAFATGLVWGAFSAVTRRVTGVAGSHALFAMTWAALF